MKTWIQIGVLLAAMVLQCQLGIALRDGQVAWMDAPEGKRQAWDPKIVRILTFGNVPSAVDWLWLRSLQDSSLMHVQPGERANIYYDLDLATSLDPAFAEAYFAGGELLAVIHSDGIGARDLVLKGDQFRLTELPSYPETFREEFWRDPWRFPLLLAYIQLFEVGDVPQAKIAYEEAAKIPSSPSYLKRVIAHLERKGGAYDFGQKVLQMLARNSKDPEVRDRYLKKLASLNVMAFLFQMNEQFRDFRAGYLHGRPAARSKEDASWRLFLQKYVPSGRDPWGGELALGPGDRIVTTTPYEKVLGLD